MRSIYFTLLLIFTVLPQASAQNWTIQDSNTDATLKAVYFVDPFTGWAVGSRGTVLYTADGGETWVQQQARTQENLHTLWFFDEYTGWVGGENNTVSYTNNAGERWSDRRPSPVTGQHIATLQFTDWRRGWAAGGPGGNVYYTEDTGTTWTRRGALGREITIKHVTVSGITGRTIRLAHGNHLYTSHNRGQDWTETVFLSDTGFTAEDLFFLNRDLGWAAGSENDSGLILKTENAGTSWNTVLKLPDQNIKSIHFLDQYYGMAITGKGILLQTQNGGSDWVISETGFEHSLNDAWFLPNGTGWIVGENGFIARLDDPGMQAGPMVAYPYPNVQISSETEAVDLLNRALKYAESAADNEIVSHRKPKYSRLQGAVENVTLYYSGRSTPGYIAERIEQLLHIYWADEHNAGAELFNRSENEPDSHQYIETAAAHFENAVTIMPDSSVSHRSLAHAYESLGFYSRAADAMESAIKKIANPETGHYDYLIQLYLQTEEYEKARQTALEGTERFSQDRIFLEYLADLHYDTGDTESAFEYLNRLIDLYPRNADYRFARGSRTLPAANEALEETLSLYEEIWNINEQLQGSLSVDERQRLLEQNRQLQNEMNRLERRAENLIRRTADDLAMVAEQQPDNDVPLAQIGMIYNNRAATLEQMRYLTPNAEQAQELNRRVIRNLQLAMEHYRKAAERNPENNDYAEMLLQIYLHLGMDQEARQLINGR